MIENELYLFGMNMLYYIFCVTQGKTSCFVNEKSCSRNDQISDFFFRERIILIPRERKIFWRPNSGNNIERFSLI